MQPSRGPPVVALPPFNFGALAWATPPNAAAVSPARAPVVAPAPAMPPLAAILAQPTAHATTAAAAAASIKRETNSATATTASASPARAAVPAAAPKAVAPATGGAAPAASNKRKPAPATTAAKAKPQVPNAPTKPIATATTATAAGAGAGANSASPRKKPRLNTAVAATAPPPAAPLSPASAAIAAAAAASRTATTTAAAAAAPAPGGGATNTSPVKAERKKTGPKPKPKPPKPASAAGGAAAGAGGGDGDDDDDSDGGGGGDDKKKSYNRKEKSLGLLCENFLKLYADGITNTQISLDTAATTLGVERRRIYDIVNILESVDIVSRKGKNNYIWHGLTRLAKALSGLQKAANAMKKSDEEKRASAGAGAAAQSPFPSGLAMLSSMAMDDDDVGKKGKKGAADGKREKSLGLLSQKFVQMFLLSDTRIVSLEEAAHALLGTEEEAIKRAAAVGAKSNFKSKVRRLYDIANVLASLQLIEKIHIVQSRKPAFKWCGAEVFPLESSVLDSSYTRDQPHKVSALQTPPPKKPKKERKSTGGDAKSAASAATSASSRIPPDPFEAGYDVTSGMGSGLTPSFSYARSSLYAVPPFDKENLAPNFIRDTSMPLIARKGSKLYQFSMDTLTPTEMAYLTQSTVNVWNGGDRHPLCMPQSQPPATAAAIPPAAAAATNSAAAAQSATTAAAAVAPRSSAAPSRAASFSGINAYADHASLPPAAVPTHALQYVSTSSGAGTGVGKAVLSLSALTHAYGSALAGWDWALPQFRELATRTLMDAHTAANAASATAAAPASTTDSDSSPPGMYTVDDDNDNELCVAVQPLPPSAVVTVPAGGGAASQLSIGAGGSQDPRTDSQLADEFLS